MLTELREFLTAYDELTRVLGALLSESMIQNEFIAYFFYNRITFQPLHLSLI